MTQQPQDQPHGTRLGHAEALHRILASKVLQGHLQNRHQLLDPPPSDLRDLSAEDATLLIRAMIAAAHANGDLDEQERRRISGVLSTTVLDADVRSVLERAMTEPVSLELLLRQVGSPWMASRFYAVSLAAVDKESAVNRAYLNYLALRLGLPADLVVRLNRRMGLRR
ncbi:DUF533 domain-containing protein [Arenibaculum pallidiluteum]|uniref:DUF533 domain-containing protein n=1 Tax=Arenibaculum pallidiluteum TaxID=2812559 RepID=UPI001A95FEE4|nr:DUF533 domain-containing protein [Arenibaculum pallidiluteum]